MYNKKKFNLLPYNRYSVKNPPTLLTSKVIIESKLEGKYKNPEKVFANLGSASVNVEGSLDSLLGSEDLLKFSNLNLLPGESLVINTCDMTVQKNGENYIKYLEDESWFFDLTSGANKLFIISEDEDIDIEADIIWRDRWL